MHWYGKAEVAPQRKVGHVTIVAPSAAEARSRLAAIDSGAAAALASTSGAQPPDNHNAIMLLRFSHLTHAVERLVGSCLLWDFLCTWCL